jgi:hypothetical protein
MEFDALFKWLYNTTLAVTIRENDSLFPWIESIHVIAIALVIGSIAIVDLRLLGIASLERAVSRVAHQTLPLTWIAFIVAAISGVILFTSNALAYAHNFYFQGKMLLLVLAGLNMLVFQFGIYTSVAKWDLAQRTPFAARIAGALSLLFWTTVIVFGRWIGFTLLPTLGS